MNEENIVLTELAKAEKYAKAEKHDLAISILANALKKVPGSFVLLLSISDMYRAIGDYQKSLHFSGLLMKKYPLIKPGYQRAAHDAMHLQKISCAQKIIKKGLKMCPSSQPELLKHASDIFFQFSEYKKSIKFSSRSICAGQSLCVKNFEIAFQRLTLTKNKAFALRSLQKCTESKLISQDALIMAIKLYQSLHNHRKSVDLSKKLVNLFSDSKLSYIISTNSLLLAKKSKPSLQTSKKGLKLFPNDLELLPLVSESHRLAKNREGSLKFSLLFFKASKKSWDACIRLSQDYAALGRSSEAKLTFDTALKKYPNQSSILNDKYSSNNTWHCLLKNFIISCLFDASKEASITSISGYTNAKFQSCTSAHIHLYGKIFQLLDYFSIRYYVFAGALVGYVRDKKFPYWMEDMDIMIFEEDESLFKTHVAKILRFIGFNVFPPMNKRYEKGGLHIIALAEGYGGSPPLKPPDLRYSDHETITIPRFQVDVFFSKIENGFVKNKSNWGLYTTRYVQECWAKPPIIRSISGIPMPIFNSPCEDVEEEYGDVFNTIVVANHGKRKLTINGMRWQDFDDLFLQHTEKFNSIPSSISGVDFSKLVLCKDKESIFCSSKSFSTICSEIASNCSGTLSINDVESLFWCIDLKRVFSNLTIKVTINSMEILNLAVLFKDFIDKVEFTGSSCHLKNIYNLKIKTFYPNEMMQKN